MLGTLKCLLYKSSVYKTMCHCPIWKTDLADGPSSSMLKALLVYGLCCCGLMGFKTLHSNEIYIEKLGLFYRLLISLSLFFFFQNWACPTVLAFVEKWSDCECYNQWTLECRRPISSESHRDALWTISLTWSVLSRFDSLQPRCRACLSRSVPILLHNDRHEASPELRQSFSITDNSPLRCPFPVSSLQALAACDSGARLWYRSTSASRIIQLLARQIKLWWKQFWKLQQRRFRFLNWACSSKISAATWFPLHIPSCLTPSSRKKVSKK